MASLNGASTDLRSTYASRRHHDAELQLISALRRSVRERGSPPLTRHVDELLDERLKGRLPVAAPRRGIDQWEACDDPR